ncbi:hypothetical protein [Nocardioides sp. Kera G14]|uniref:hypothetical protein n=1 Tax=Nocardioides sp. Kera G14 TaxID=2884264 RepID=UPI001D10C19F|nr:hypothetical protein [Nocardioides sp. Kera G14]UDY24098.1 hypothetical protein LH076_02030 [Nocardioides sp. Kera G14]
MVSRDSLHRRLRRLVLGHRRLLAGLLAAVAVGAGLQVLRPPQPEPSVVEAPPASLGARLGAAHPGLVPIPVRLPDAGMADLLEPGDRLTVLATDTSGAGDATSAGTVAVADDVLVLDVPRSGSSTSAENGVMDSAAGRLVIIGVEASAVGPVTNAAVRSVLTFSWDH